MTLLAVVGVWFQKARHRAMAITCTNHLMQAGLSFRTWALDHEGSFPMGLSTNDSGRFEYLATGEAFRHFQVISNQLITARMLVCPDDSRRSSLSFVPNFSNSNQSYFVGEVTNDPKIQMFLSGDRNLAGGVLRASGILELTTNSPIGWNKRVHAGVGNVLIADGAVLQLGILPLNRALAATGTATNRLAIP